MVFVLQLATYFNNSLIEGDKSMPSQKNCEPSPFCPTHRIKHARPADVHRPDRSLLEQGVKLTRKKSNRQHTSQHWWKREDPADGKYFSTTQGVRQIKLPHQSRSNFRQKITKSGCEDLALTLADLLPYVEYIFREYCIIMYVLHSCRENSAKCSLVSAIIFFPKIPVKPFFGT